MINKTDGFSLQNPASCHTCPLRLRGNHAPNTQEEIDFIQKFKKEERVVAAGSAILHERSAGGDLFTLREGWAFRYRTLSDGRRQILNFLFPGDFTGLQAELTGQLPYGVEALTPVRVCTFRSSELWELYQQFPQLGYNLTWLSAHEELIVDENLLSVGRRTALERTAMLLIHISKRAHAVGEQNHDGVPFPLNQQHIADALGLSLVHTNKTLRRLEAIGLHEIRNNKLKILKPDALEKLAAYYKLPMRQTPLI
jgi:CRP/FNR family transcriptional regulator, anaerobic regulatory protein